jgi:Lon protease-like protein
MIAVETLNQQAEIIDRLRTEEAQAQAVKKAISEQLEVAEKTMIELLVAADLKTYPAPAGKCTVTYRTSVKLPQTPEEKEALAEYCRAKGKYEMVFKPNSQSLNSFWKEEFDAAAEAGADDFQMPGVSGITITPNLSFTRSK